MSARHYFPNLREPVVLWLLLLIGIFYATIALLLIVSHVNEVRIERCNLQIEQQRNCRAISSGIQKKLLLLGHLAHHFVEADDEHELEVLRRNLTTETDSLRGAVAELAESGVIEAKLSAHPMNIDGIASEVVGLTAGANDLTDEMDELSRLVHKRFPATSKDESNSLNEAVVLNLKAVSDTIQSSRERANQIYYDTARRLTALEASHAKNNSRMYAAKYITITASVVLAALVGGLILMRVSRNLADRDRAAAELQRSKQTTQAILHKLPLGVAVIGRDKIIRYVNDTAMSMTGYSSNDELVGKPCHATLCPTQADRCPILQLGQSLDNSERVLMTRDNREIPILKTVIPVELDGEEVLLETFIDISERKKAEKLLQNYAGELEETNHALKESNNAAQDANKAKSEFLANMSHELRTPLHGILSFATFGRKKAQTADPEKLQQYFEKIDSSGKTLLHLVNDLLDLSKLEAGKMILDPTQVDLFKLMQLVADEFSSRVAHRSITISCEKQPVDTTITADRTRLEQVIRNLLSNAIKFSPQGSIIEMQADMKDETIMVSVLDQGVGIPKEELEQIFGKFIQSSATRTGAGGTGLGLSICREIIDYHKGRIWAENRPEGGAVFRFEIPIGSGKSNSSEQNPQPTAQVAGSR